MFLVSNSFFKVKKRIYIKLKNEPGIDEASNLTLEAQLSQAVNLTERQTLELNNSPK